MTRTAYPRSAPREPLVWRNAALECDSEGLVIETAVCLTLAKWETCPVSSGAISR